MGEELSFSPSHALRLFLFFSFSVLPLNLVIIARLTTVTRERFPNNLMLYYLFLIIFFSVVVMAIRTPATLIASGNSWLKRE